MPANSCPKPKGVHCIVCQSFRLVTTHTRRVCPGKTVRYRVCSVCETKVITEETIARERESETPKGKLPNRDQSAIKAGRRRG